ncbi:MAG: Na+/H+ antiporter [Cyanobacteria bacterium RYN_339]|nr:Na+/H+ antiporter [Cyanobacteria bacterium RYN_339]
MHTIELLIGLFMAFLVVMAVARRLSVPFPITLVAGGLLLSLVPGLPAVELPSELVLLVFLPPLLYAEACVTSWRDFKANLRPIGLLSIGLVIATTLTVAATAHWLLPELPWAACFILGAVVAPTDAVAALAIAHHLPLPRRVVTILVGESLVNDATALVAYRIAISAVLTGSFSAGETLLRFVGVCLGGVALGLAVGWAMLRLFKLLGSDSLMVNAVGLLVPFIAYLPAEALGVSGVLAVVTSGLWIGRQAAEVLAATTRVASRALWEMVDFLLNGLLFLLVGLQLRTILHEPLPHGLAMLAAFGVVIAITVIATRIAWVYPATYLPRWLSLRLRQRDPLPAPKNVFVLAWTGMRGGISLAAALALPTVLASGQPFPGRGEIVVLTFIVILCTLVVQGLTLPLVIRRLGVQADGSEEREADEARLMAARAGLARLDALAEADDIALEVFEPLQRHYQEEINRLCVECGIEPDPNYAQRIATMDHMWREALEAERQAMVRLRDEGAIGDDVLNELLAELDRQVVWLAEPGSR